MEILTSEIVDKLQLGKMEKNSDGYCKRDRTIAHIGLLDVLEHFEETCDSEYHKEQLLNQFCLLYILSIFMNFQELLSNHMIFLATSFSPSQSCEEFQVFTISSL